MARGKEALAAANRRYEAAVQHIDRLTSELAEAKLRARQAEKGAGLVPHLQARVADLERRERDDVVVRELTQALAEASAVVKLDATHIKALWGAVIGLMRDHMRFTKMTNIEVTEYVTKRWPGIFRGEVRDVVRAGGRYKGLSDEAVRRIQRLKGHRTPSDDPVTTLADAMEAVEAGFSPSEILELVGLEAGAGS